MSLLDPPEVSGVQDPVDGSYKAREGPAPADDGLSIKPKPFPFEACITAVLQK